MKQVVGICNYIHHSYSLYGTSTIAHYLPERFYSLDRRVKSSRDKDAQVSGTGYQCVKELLFRVDESIILKEKVNDSRRNHL